VESKKDFCLITINWEIHKIAIRYLFILFQEKRMKSTSLRISLFMSAMLIVILACGAPGSSSTTVPATEASDSVTPPPTELPIQHQVIPVNLPVDRSSHAGDFDSSTTAAQKVSAGGDRFTFGRFERPFNANTMDVYFPEIDIVDTLVFQDETWIFGKIVVKGNESNSLSGKYAVELDTDVDGKGDWLVIAAAPSSAEWTTEGVQVYQDANKDVGNASAMYTDSSTGDGFETLVFDQGNGDDPDSAWVRVSADAANTIEISIKRSVLGTPAKYLVNMWAGNVLDPALFDINDRYTHEQAGAADRGLEIFYPIKQVYEIDNSCRMAVGFEPTGQEPGLCEVFIPRAPGSPPQGCQASQTQISSCNQDPSYSWNAQQCSCEYVGPR
jgi:hypothetical protein